jgi:putative oxidoreductase
MLKQESACMKFLEKYKDYAYALMRIMTGLMFSFHGAQKLFGLLSEFQPAIGSQIWFAGIIELVGGLAVMLGFQTRLAAFLCSGEMAVAYFQAHWKFQAGPAFFPTINKGELALLYCFVFLFIAFRGGVKWSLDKTNMEAELTNESNSPNKAF